ncbi:hypothetical protein SteCoe_19753 [Stentor coeruleus]|uniref:Uncharacterized protein n=1 Tax=Stentor coeruleus TaxID=5963 RepID=A0A1R2BTB7_9CILI|nr:hypothetical protein SteCoe_19753 [Stentor coeruleus]
MNEFPGIITNVEGECATIEYSREDSMQEYKLDIKYFEIENQEHCSIAEKILYVKTNALIKIVNENNQGKVLIAKPDCNVLFGKIESANEEIGNISVSVFKEEGLFISPIYSVFFEDQPASWEAVRNYMNFPVEIIMNRESCVKVTILNKIPFEIPALFNSVNDRYLYLQTKNIKYRVLFSRSFYRTNKNSIKIRKINKLKGKTGKIIVCLSGYRVEFEKPIKVQNTSLEIVKEKKLNNIAQGMRVSIENYLPNLAKFKELAHWQMYSNKDVNYDLQLTIYIGMLETFLLVSNHEKIRSLFLCKQIINNSLYDDVKNIVNVDFFFTNFYYWIKREFENLKVCAKEISKFNLDFEQISQKYSVSFNVFAIVRGNVMNSFYGRIDNYPVINLLIIDDFSAVIYNPSDLAADGFDSNGKEIGKRSRRNARSCNTSGLNEKSFYHLLEFMSKNSSQTSLVDESNIISKIYSMASDDNNATLKSTIDKVLYKCRE